jgi:hypothetical protein
MRVQVADVHVQRLVSVVKIATVLECTTEKQRSVVHFLWKKDSMQRIFIKKYFQFMVGSVCCVKRFTTGSRNSLKDVRKSQMMPTRPGRPVEIVTEATVCAVGRRVDSS